MTKQTTKIQITADALIALRINKKLMDEFDLEDPLAHHFDTKEGQIMAALITEQFESIYPAYNLARFKYFTKYIQDNNFQQVVFLGSGYDTRSIWMTKFQTGLTEIFEVDFPEKLESKRVKLSEVGIHIPSYVHYVLSDISEKKLPELLIEKGFNVDLKTLVIIEGVVFFLPSKTSETVLSPHFLNLQKGSIVLADFWTETRVNALNAIAKKKMDKELFDTFRHCESQNTAHNFFQKAGYSDISISKLDDIVNKICSKDLSTELSAGWLVLEATL